MTVSDSGSRIRPASLGLVAALLLVAACSGAGDSSAADSSSASSTTSTTSIATAPTTTTVTPPSTTPTTDPITAAEDAAIQAVLDKAEAWRACIADVPTCNPRESLEPTTTGESLESLVSGIADWQSNGWEARSPANPSHVGEEIISVEILDERLTEAKVTLCQVDGVVIFDPAGGPDGEDVVVDDSVSSLLAESFVQLNDDGQWRVNRTDLLKKFEGGEGCSEDDESQ